MNRLLCQVAYLCGPIDRCPDSGRGWRDDISPKLKKLGIVPLNPLDKPTYGIDLEDEENRIKRKKCESNEDWSGMAKLMKPIRNIDLRFVDKSDFLIVNLDMSLGPCGTLEELFVANLQKKPILVYSKEGKGSIPHWLFGTIPHDLFFTSWSDIIDYLTEIKDSLEEPETYGRWRFLDLAPMFKEVLGMYDERPLDIKTESKYSFNSLKC